MSKLVTIYGGSGFLGRYITQRMARAGWRVRVAVRRPNDAIFVRYYGVVGQVEPVLCNIRDDASVAEVMTGADAVVNCVGILVESGKNKFNLVQRHGAARVARAARAEGVSRLVQISAIGADAGSPSDYASSKGLGERDVVEAFPGAIILRPSIVFGPEDQFFNRFAAMSRLGPAIPVVGAGTRFQPVYVGDIAAACHEAVTNPAVSGIYELGGPEVMTFRELMGLMLEVIQRRRAIIGVPFPVATVMGAGFDLLETVSFGLFSNTLITRDQVTNLRADNVVAAGARTLADLGVAPTPMAAVLPEYLWRYRPSGQYADIKQSAKNLRD